MSALHFPAWCCAVIRSCGRVVTLLAPMQRAHMKALEMANTLGLSNSLMRVIQRRTSGDKVLVYGGMVLITILLYFVYRFTRAA